MNVNFFVQNYVFSIIAYVIKVTAFGKVDWYSHWIIVYYLKAFNLKMLE